MIVLGIETSCDETSAAVVDDQRALSNIIATQQVHQAYGGVVPEFASRAHMRQLTFIIREALQTAQIGFEQIEGIAVTCGPGLAGSLLVGLCAAKGLAMSLKVPYIGINHLEGHLAAAAVDGEPLKYPFIALVVSGGHTLLVHGEKPFSYRIIGRTIDDAAGEAFDKAAKILGLGYPGGPAVEKAGRDGDPQRFHFPRALLDRDNLDFSFSGLKTAVLYLIRRLLQEGQPVPTADIAASFQQAVADVLVAKTMRAVETAPIRELILAGGVMRNTIIRTAFQAACQEKGIEFRVPSPLLCTDNAGMIARAGHLRLTAGMRSDWSLDVYPNLSLDQPLN